MVGGGDTAMEEALFLTKYASEVHLIHRRDSFRASKIMQQRVREHPKITIHFDSAVEDVLGEQAVEGVVVRNLKTGAAETLPVQGFFVAIGHQPNTGDLPWHPGDGRGRLPEALVEHTMTNVPGVFVAGDVDDHRYRQAVTAAGDGCRAAIDAERWLEAQHAVDTTTVSDPREYGQTRPAETATNPA